MHIKIILVSILFFVIGSQGCHNEIKEKSRKSLKEVGYPDGRVGNYVMLNDSVINEFNLNDENLKSYQYYTSDNIEIELHSSELLKDYKTDSKVVVKRDTQLVHVKTIFINKYTPCIILKRYKRTELRNALGVKNVPVTIIGGYEVDVGNGIILEYSTFFRYFMSVIKTNVNKELKQFVFKQNAHLL